MKIIKKFDDWIENPDIFMKGYLVGMCIMLVVGGMLFLLALKIC